VFCRSCGRKNSAFLLARQSFWRDHKTECVHGPIIFLRKLQQGLLYTDATRTVTMVAIRRKRVPSKIGLFANTATGICQVNPALTSGSAVQPKVTFNVEKSARREPFRPVPSQAGETCCATILGREQLLGGTSFLYLHVIRSRSGGPVPPTR